MDIHKPKPWRGFREFFKEYLIIVVGVLTALGGEQLVERLHWRHQVEATDERLSAEVRSNLTLAYSRLMSQRCYDQRLAGLSEQLRGHGHWRGAAIERRPVPAPETIPPLLSAGIMSSAAPPVYMTWHGIWPDSSWSSALSSGATLHMGQDRAQRYAGLYASFASMGEVQTRETSLGSQLSALAFDRELSEPERTHFLEVVGQLSFMNVWMASNSRGVIERAAAVGIRLGKSEAARHFERNRHYYLLQDCLEAVSIPVAND